MVSEAKLTLTRLRKLATYMASTRGTSRHAAFASTASARCGFAAPVILVRPPVRRLCDVKQELTVRSQHPPYKDRGTRIALQDRRRSHSQRGNFMKKFIAAAIAFGLLGMGVA